MACFACCSDPYVKLSLYVADENRELALVQTKTIKKVGKKVRTDFDDYICGVLLLPPFSCTDLWLVVSDLVNSCSLSWHSNLLLHLHLHLPYSLSIVALFTLPFKSQIFDHLLMPPPPLHHFWQSYHVENHKKTPERGASFPSQQSVDGDELFFPQWPILGRKSVLSRGSHYLL